MEALSNLVPHLEQLQMLALWGRLGSRLWNGFCFGKSHQNKEQWGAAPSRRVITSMTQPLFPSAIGTQSRVAKILTIKPVVRKLGKSDGQTGSWCLEKAVLAQGEGGGGVPNGCRAFGGGQKAVYGGTCAAHALLLRRVYPDQIGFHRLPECPPKKSKPMGTRPV